MQPHERVNAKLKHLFINNFIGGIAWGLGATVGVSIVLGVFGIIISKVNLIPVIGDFVSEITTFVLQNNPSLR